MKSVLGFLSRESFMMSPRGSFPGLGMYGLLVALAAEQAEHIGDLVNPEGCVPLGWSDWAVSKYIEREKGVSWTITEDERPSCV